MRTPPAGRGGDVALGDSARRELAPNSFDLLWERAVGEVRAARAGAYLVEEAAKIAASLTGSGDSEAEAVRRAVIRRADSA